jgi:tetratricopeptide (TPR) repeat protein
MHSEFPHFGIILLANGLDTVLLASNRPLLPTADNIAAVQKMVDADPEIATDLQRYLGAKDLRALLARYYQLGEDQIKPLLKDDPSQLLNTDLHLRLEFDAPLHLFRKLKQQESATAALLKAVDPKWIERLAIATGVKRDSPEFRSMVAEYYRSIAALRTTQKRESEAMDALRELIRLVPGDASAHAEIAQRYLHDKQLADAVKHFREALRNRPDVGTIDGSNMWANNLAWILATSKDAKLRNGEEAVLWATKSCAADQRKSPATLDTLAAALAEVGRFDEAIRVAEEVLALAKGQPAVVQTTQDRIRSFKEAKPIRE